jgi:hypothetical protein
MSKIKSAHKVVSILSILLIVGVFFEVYRVTSLMEFNEIEILYTYDTIKIGVPMLLMMIYVIVFLTTNNMYNRLDYTLKRCYLIIMMSFIIIAYDFGLNTSNLLGNETAYRYQPIVSIWIFSIIILGFAFLNAYIIYKYINIRNRNIRIDIIQGFLTLLYLFIFIALVTDSTFKMGVFD